MDIKFRITKYLAVSALAMLLLGACSKNNIYINYPDEENNGGSSGSGNDDNNGNPTKENALITFSASVEGRNITRAMSPMGKDFKAGCVPIQPTHRTISQALPLLKATMSPPPPVY